MKLILLSLSLLGLGAIGGYITFHLMLSSRCSHLLVETESRHKLALKELQAKNQKVTEDYVKCMHDEGTKQQLLELQGRLEAQSVLAERHQELVTKYDATQRDLQQLQEEKTHHLQVIEEHRVAVEDLQNKLQEQASLGDVAVVREELEQVSARLGEVQRDMEYYREQLEGCVHERHGAQEEANELRNALNEREQVLHQVNERLLQMEEEEVRRREEEEEYHRLRQEEEEEHRRREEEEEEYRRREEEEEAYRRDQEEGHETHEGEPENTQHNEGEEL